MADKYVGIGDAPVDRTADLRQPDWPGTRTPKEPKAPKVERHSRKAAEKAGVRKTISGPESFWDQVDADARALGNCRAEHIRRFYGAGRLKYREMGIILPGEMAQNPAEAVRDLVRRMDEPSQRLDAYTTGELLAEIGRRCPDLGRT